MMWTRSLFAASVLIVIASLSFAQDDYGVDPEALIDQILQVDKSQRDKIKDLTLDAVLTDGKRDRDSLIEKARFYKKIYINSSVKVIKVNVNVKVKVKLNVNVNVKVKVRSSSPL